MGRGGGGKQKRRKIGCIIHKRKRDNLTIVEIFISRMLSEWNKQQKSKPKEVHTNNKHRTSPSPPPHPLHTHIGLKCKFHLEYLSNIKKTENDRNNSLLEEV